jgi:hypothetical protein
LLLQPFFAGALLSGRWTWLFLPAAGLALSGFLLREPLTVVVRHRWLWRRRGPQLRAAERWAALLFALLLVCLIVLLRNLPAMPLLVLTATGAALTSAAVAAAVRNLQRSAVFQVASAMGLSTTGLLASLAATGGVPQWAWQLWAVLSAHAGASILAVHARLDARAGRSARKAVRRAAWAAQALECGAALTAGRLALPLVFSALANAAELWRLRSPDALREPLTRVGFRTLAVALLHMAAAVYALWPAARG